VCDLDVMGAPSKLSVIRKAASFARDSPLVNPAFELLNENHTTEVELVSIMLRKLNP
jgi:hypothetical protein